jgi:hypothetical protein
MEFIQNYAKEIFSVLLPIITWIFSRLSNKGAKLIRGTKHAFTFLINEPLKGPDGAVLSATQLVRTSSVVIHNIGGAPCTNLELVFNWKPMCINVWPTRHFKETTEPDGRYVLIFSSLAPNEHFGFETLAVNAELPLLINARCDQCVAQEVHISQSPRVSPTKIRITQFLALAGFAAVAYTAIQLLQFLLVKTPGGVGP